MGILIRRTGAMDRSHSEGEIVGRVSVGGSPLNHYAVELMEGNGAPGGDPIVVRDAAGRFALRHVQAGNYSIAIRGPRTALTVIEEVVVRMGETLNLGEITLQPGRRVSGLVCDGSGAPVSGALTVIGHGSFGQGASVLIRLFSARYETTTDGSGAFALYGVEPYPRAVLPLMISAMHPTKGASLVQQLPLDGSNVDLVLMPTGRIDGRLRPLPGGPVTVCAQRSDEPALARIANVTDAGEFSFSGVPEGNYAVKLLGEGCQVSGPTDVSVTANRSAAVTFSVTPTVLLKVRVPTQNDSALAAPILTRVEGQHDIKSELRVSFPDGSIVYYFYHVSPGRYMLGFESGSLRDINIRGTPREQTVKIKRRK